MILTVHLNIKLLYEYLQACCPLIPVPIPLCLFLFLLSPGSSLPRMLPLSGPIRVEAMFAHTPSSSEAGGGGGACLLHFLPGDGITLLISEPRDGWHYGQNERTGRYVAPTDHTKSQLCSSVIADDTIIKNFPPQERLVPFLLHSAAPQIPGKHRQQVSIQGIMSRLQKLKPEGVL